MSALREITPTRQNRIIDLVRDAGIDVSDWANFKGRNPATNPKYCYEWAFTDGDQVIVLNLWLEKMKEENGHLVYRMNLRNDARELRRTRGQSLFAGRATRMDRIARNASELSVPVQVIVCDGTRREVSDERSSQVKKRLLDPKSWAVTYYNDATGDCVLIRGASPIKIIDQFSLEELGLEQAERRIALRSDYRRSREVRNRVLRRSAGRCEFCNTLGFLTGDGSIFIETHHVVPLSEGGADKETNVVALCPNHHREAHYGQRRDELRATLLARFREWL